jgi:septum formation protein
MSRPRIVLASGSAIRARVLAAAGVAFEIARPDVDEAAIKAAGLRDGLALAEIAQRLADAKAIAAGAQGGAIVLASDQLMAFDGRAYDKPRTIGEARARLRLLQGRAHTLINAVAIAQGGAIVFRHLDAPTLFMRTMSDAEIDAYLNEAGEEILSSVGAYQVEALGARLFDRIEGDYFAVLGLALMPVLGFLRDEGALAY